MVVFCTRCGAQNEESNYLCYHCQAQLPAISPYQPNYEPIRPPPTFRAPLVNWRAQGADKKVPAAICGMLPPLGVFGIHKFILGYTKEGVIQIFIGLITCGAGSIIGLIEGIIYLTKSDEDFVRTYIQNKKGWF